MRLVRGFDKCNGLWQCHVRTHLVLVAGIADLGVYTGECSDTLLLGLSPPQRLSRQRKMAVGEDASSQSLDFAGTLDGLDQTGTLRLHDQRDVVAVSAFPV